MLARMFDRRCRGYEAIGYTVVLPASAIPGWPADVVLPSDPVWKRDYSGSVRRLVRDGVDTPLARLFTHVTRPLVDDATGANRARSATEAFLYRRLQTLPETKGRFSLNARLPIPFDSKASLEVDLLCSYLVLRFLAEDVGKELDLVLDAILRSLSNRGLLRRRGHTSTFQLKRCGAGSPRK